jgi:hypothetical protein
MHRFIAIAIISVPLASAPAGAAPLFFDDFEGVTPPAAPSSANWATTGGTTTARDSTTFGTLTTYVSIAPVTSGSLFSNNLASLPAVTTLSFRFVDNTPFSTVNNVSNDSLQVGWADDGGDLNSTDQVVKFLLNQGTIRGATGNTLTAASAGSTSYSLGTPHTLNLIYNSSDTATLSDYEGTRDLEPDTAHLYVDGVYAGALVPSATQAARIPGRFGFRVFTSNETVNVKVDDVKLLSGAVVPEPATLSLLGGGALALLARRRRSA